MVPSGAISMLACEGPGQHGQRRAHGPRRQVDRHQVGAALVDRDHVGGGAVGGQGHGQGDPGDRGRRPGPVGRQVDGGEVAGPVGVGGGQDIGLVAGRVGLDGLGPRRDVDGRAHRTGGQVDRGDHAGAGLQVEGGHHQGGRRRRGGQHHRGAGGRPAEGDADPERPEEDDQGDEDDDEGVSAPFGRGGPGVLVVGRRGARRWDTPRGPGAARTGSVGGGTHGGEGARGAGVGCCWVRGDPPVLGEPGVRRLARGGPGRRGRGTGRGFGDRLEAGGRSQGRM